MQSANPPQCPCLTFRVDVGDFGTERRDLLRCGGRYRIGIGCTCYSSTDLGDGTYALACIPFMAYGLAIGDVVRLGDDGRVAALVEARGRRVLRLMLVDNADQDRLGRAVSEIEACIASARLLSEWNGPRFVAVDVPPAGHPEAVFAVMGRLVEEGRGYWEWAGAHQFA